MVEGGMQGFLGVEKLTEGDWFIATRTDPARTNLSHEGPTFAVLFTEQTYATGRALVDGVGLSGLCWQKLGDRMHRLVPEPVSLGTTGIRACAAQLASGQRTTTYPAAIRYVNVMERQFGLLLR